MKAVLVPHSHWDREWYEPFSVFRLKLRAMMDGVLDQLAREPGFRHFHLDGQTVMLDDYLEMRPEREAEVAGLVRAGRLSVGPMFTLTDEFLVSGESIVRNLELGLARAASLGVPTPVGGPWAGYLPDQFGHVGQMPQILRSLGIERAVVLRGVPAAVDRSAFVWRSPDGSEVLTEYLIHGYYLGADIDEPPGQEGMGPDLAGAIETAASVSDRDVVLVPVGADHWTPVPGMFDRALAAAPETGHDVEVGSLARFLALAGRPAGAPVWHGELRAASTWVLLPNTIATRAHQKRRRGVLETRLERYAEPLAALVPGVEWPAAELARAWRAMLLNAGHDCAYGASHDAVALDVDARFDEVESITDAVVAAAAGALARRAAAPGVLRWNPSPFEREGVPGLGWIVVAPDQVPAEAPAPLTVRGTDVVLDDGTRVSVTDEDDDGDLFTFSPPPGAQPRTPESVTQAGPGAARFTFAGVTVDVAATRRPGERFTRLALRVDNARDDHRLRLWVSLREAPDRAVAVAPFEVVERPLIGEGFESEIGSPTWPASGAVLAGGTALLTEGVVEYEVSGDRIGLTLLRAVGQLARPTLPTRPIWAGPPMATPGGQCHGVWNVAVGVLPDATPNDLCEQRERFALPLLDVEAHGGGDLVPGRLLQVDGACLSSVRRDGDELRVRVWNPTDRAVDAMVQGRAVPLGPARIAETRIPAGS